MGDFQRIDPMAAMEQVKAGWHPETRARWEASEERIRQRVAAGLPPVLEPTACPGCKGAGVVYARAWIAGEDHHPDIIPCDQCDTGDRIRTSQMARNANGSLANFKHITFANLPAKAGQETYWNWGQGFAQNPSGFAWITGGYYLGKTVLVQCVANAMADRGLPVVYYDQVELFDELRRTFDREEASNFSTKWASLIDAPYLVLDDFGKAQKTAWVEERIFTLTNHRLERNLCTIVTTNLEQHQMEQQYPRLAHRIYDGARTALIPFTNQPVVGGKRQRQEAAR